MSHQGNDIYNEQKKEWEEEKMKTKESVKHTPGPWKANFDINAFDEIEVVSGKFHIAYVGPCVNFSSEETKANARLIAAAPELLAVLNEMNDVVQSGKGWAELSAYFIQRVPSLIAKVERR